MFTFCVEYVVLTSKLTLAVIQIFIQEVPNSNLAEDTNLWMLNILGAGYDRVHLVRRPLVAQVMDEYGTVSGVRTGRGNRNSWRKPALVPLCPPQIPHDLT
jgi:hypothetical protein